MFSLTAVTWSKYFNDLICQWSVLLLFNGGTVAGAKPTSKAKRARCYKCDVCGKPYQRSSYVRIHKVLKHQIADPTIKVDLYVLETSKSLIQKEWTLDDSLPGHWKVLPWSSFRVVHHQYHMTKPDKGSMVQWPLVARKYRLECPLLLCQDLWWDSTNCTVMQQKVYSSVLQCTVMWQRVYKSTVMWQRVIFAVWQRSVASALPLPLVCLR